MFWFGSLLTCARWTHRASDLGKSKNVKTISSALIIQALQELELDALIPAVNETLVQLKATKKKAPSATKSAADANNGSDKGKEDNHDDEHAASSAAAAAAEDADGTEAEVCVHLHKFPLLSKTFFFFPFFQNSGGGRA